MAVIHPAGWRELEALGAAQREIETLARLEKELPDTHAVYHGVHWTRLQSGFSACGEVDFIVVGPNARVMLIEQKSGFLEETPDGLHKMYRQEKKNVARQISRSVEALQARYAQGHGGERLTIDYLLYCPDYTVQRPHVAGIDPGQIVDAKRRDQLAAIIQAAIAKGDDDPKRTELVRRFFEGVLELVPEIGAVSEAARGMYSRLSGGLAAWARKIEMDPFRLRVVGTAGFRQNPACALGTARRRCRRPARALCLLQPPARGSSRADRAANGDGRHLPSAVRPGRTQSRSRAGLHGAGRLRRPGAALRRRGRG